MTKAWRHRRAQPSPISLGGTAREALPFPYVHYPNHYGTFFAFAEKPNGPHTLCSCSQGPIENLLRLKEARQEHLNSNTLRMVRFDSWFFPGPIAEESLRNPAGGMEMLRFGDGLCHRCNMIAPTMRYCLEMYGTRFIQHFGWYVNQSYLRNGIRPMTLDLLPDVCPPDLQGMILDAQDLNRALADELLRLNQMVHGPQRPDIAGDELTYWHNVRPDEAQPFIELRGKASQAMRRATKRIENFTREEFGYKKVGEAWVSETLLSQLVARVLPGIEIKTHHRPPWLGGLELDIFVPSKRVACEYQGQQHFHAIKARGGETAQAELKKRDQKKANLCKKNGITLIGYVYSEPLTEAHVRLRLEEAAEDQKVGTDST